MVSPKSQVLILTAYEDESILREAINAGASGYITKRAVEEDLISAIKAVSRGDMYIHPGITRLLVQSFTPPVKTKSDALNP